jgi:hypothetical protein
LGEPTITPKLIVGEKYYVSFGSNDTYPCRLLKILHEYDTPEVEIEIPIKAGSKKGFKDVNGKTSHNWVSTHILKANEIGITPEEAVLNTVTN